MADDKPIIIIKKKGGHGGHHGGAWKVAYADFVTAMMAFFMVMWLVSAAQTPTKQAIASYFRKPGFFESGSGTPLLIGEAGILQDGFAPSHPEDTKQLYSGKSKERLHGHTGTDSEFTGDKRITYRGEEGKRDSVPDRDAAQRGFQATEPEDFNTADELTLNKRPIDKKTEEKVGEPDSFGVTKEQKEQALAVAAQVQQELAASPEFKELLGLVDVKLDADGLNIEIMDTEKTSMFQSGSALIQREAEEAFSKLGPIIARFPNTVDIVGHTDARPFGRRPGGYGNWDLSSDRANAARKILERNGVPIDRIASVTGRADRELKVQADPLAAANRRITLKVRFMPPAPVTQPTVAPTMGGDSGRSELPRATSTAVPRVTQPAREEEATNQAEESEPKDGPVDDSRVIIEGLRRNKGRVKIGDGQVPVENPTPPPKKDKIFGDSPVVGPANLFTNP